MPPKQHRPSGEGPIQPHEPSPVRSPEHPVPDEPPEPAGSGDGANKESDAEETNG